MRYFAKEKVKMKELQQLKPLAEQFFALSVELLEVIDADEQEYARFIESVKKTPAGKYFISRA